MSAHVPPGDRAVVQEFQNRVARARAAKERRSQPSSLAFLQSRQTGLSPPRVSRKQIGGLSVPFHQRDLNVPSTGPAAALSPARKPPPLGAPQEESASPTRSELRQLKAELEAVRHQSQQVQTMMLRRLEQLMQGRGEVHAEPTATPALVDSFNDVPPPVWPDDDSFQDPSPFAASTDAQHTAHREGGVLVIREPAPARTSPKRATHTVLPNSPPRHSRAHHGHHHHARGGSPARGPCRCLASPPAECCCRGRYAAVPDSPHVSRKLLQDIADRQERFIEVEPSAFASPLRAQRYNKDAAVPLLPPDRPTFASKQRQRRKLEEEKAREARAKARRSRKIRRIRVATHKRVARQANKSKAGRASRKTGKPRRRSAKARKVVRTRSRKRPGSRQSRQSRSPGAAADAGGREGRRKRGGSQDIMPSVTVVHTGLDPETRRSQRGAEEMFITSPGSSPPVVAPHKIRRY